jgi:MFS family permease
MSSETLDTLPEPYSRAEIVRWWEGRRVRYNMLVGSVGIVTWLLVLCFGSLAVKAGVDFEEPIMMIIGPAIYAIGANLCFTLGWIVDTSLYRGRPRNRLWKAGLIFSLVLTALPGIWAVIAWCITLYTGKKLD